MYCQDCGSTGNKLLYRCMDCYQEGEPDRLLCISCRDEHDDANDGNAMEYESFIECKECGNVLHEESGTPFIPYDPED